MSTCYVQRSTDRLFRPSEHRHTLKLQSFQIDLGTRPLLISLQDTCQPDCTALLVCGRNCRAGALHNSLAFLV